MMIISQEAMIKELDSTRKNCSNYMQRANLCILLANNFMAQASDNLMHPDFVSIKNNKVSEAQVDEYSEIYAAVKELSAKINELSKTSTRYVQDYEC